MKKAYFQNLKNSHLKLFFRNFLFSCLFLFSLSIIHFPKTSSFAFADNSISPSDVEPNNPPPSSDGGGGGGNSGGAGGGGQAPEPATFALLGAGGLYTFYRNKLKKTR